MQFSSSEMSIHSFGWWAWLMSPGPQMTCDEICSFSGVSSAVRDVFAARDAEKK